MRGNSSKNVAATAAPHTYLQQNVATCFQPRFFFINFWQLLFMYDCAVSVVRRVSVSVPLIFCGFRYQCFDIQKPVLPTMRPSKLTHPLHNCSNSKYSHMHSHLYITNTKDYSVKQQNKGKKGKGGKGRNLCSFVVCSPSVAVAANVAIAVSTLKQHQRATYICTYTLQPRKRKLWMPERIFFEF